MSKPEFFGIVGEGLVHEGRAAAKRAVGHRLDDAPANPIVAAAFAADDLGQLLPMLGPDRRIEAQAGFAPGARPAQGVERDPVHVRAVALGRAASERGLDAELDRGIDIARPTRPG